MGEVIAVDFGGPGPVLTKTQLAGPPEIRRSRRWIEQRVAEGMPSMLDGNRRMFRVAEVTAWLDAHGFKRSRLGPVATPSKPVKPKPKAKGGHATAGISERSALPLSDSPTDPEIAELERLIGKLAKRVAELGRRDGEIPPGAA